MAEEIGSAILEEVVGEAIKEAFDRLCGGTFGWCCLTLFIPTWCCSTKELPEIDRRTVFYARCGLVLMILGAYLRSKVDVLGMLCGVIGFVGIIAVFLRRTIYWCSRCLPRVC